MLHRFLPQGGSASGGCLIAVQLETSTCQTVLVVVSEQIEHSHSKTTAGGMARAL